MNNSNLILQCKDGGDYKPHPEGIHPAICVDVIDLGLVETEFQGQRKMTPKVKVVFESEQKTDEGKNCSISKNFTASLHPKAKLAEFLGKWRGRPLAIGETIELEKLIGACCTLVISHQQNAAGKTYAAIDAVSKPTRKLVPSGWYDPGAARQRIAEWKAKGEVRGTNARNPASPDASARRPYQGNAPVSQGGVKPPPPVAPVAPVPEEDDVPF